MEERKSWELTRKDRNEMQDFFLYQKYVMDQEEQFKKIMDFVNNLINKLKEEGTLSDYTELRARIKAPISAFKNDENKAVDDVFGMEVITSTEAELEKIIEEVTKWMTIQKEKNHNKPNGYKAKHKTMTFRKDKIEEIGIDTDNFNFVPMIEFQFKTIEVAIAGSIGTASHTGYKQDNQEEIQKKYDDGEYTAGKSGIFEIPTMWSSKDGKMIMLTPEETLKKIYPFLKIKKKTEQDKGEQK